MTSNMKESVCLASDLASIVLSLKIPGGSSPEVFPPLLLVGISYEIEILANPT